MREQIGGGQPLPASTVLLIEADPSLRRLILLGLSHSGMHVLEASSVRELAGLDTRALDLLIVDVDQGLRSDWSQLSMLREQAHLATLPIVALSWENPAEDKISVLEEDGHRRGQDGSISDRLPGSAQGPHPLQPFPRPLRDPICSRSLVPPTIVRRGADPSVGVGGEAVGRWGQTCGARHTGYSADPGCHARTSHKGNTPRLPVGDLTCLCKPFDARTLHGTIAKLLAEQAAEKAAQVAMVEARVLASYEQHAAPSIWPVVTAAGLLLVVTGLLLHFLVALVGVVLILTSLLLWTLGTKPAPTVSPPAMSGLSGSA